MNGALVHVDDAIDYLARHLSEKFGLATASRAGALPVGPIQCAPHYDVEVKYVADAFWQPRGVGVLNQTLSASEPYLRPFFDAAWQLCRMGILRPGETAPSLGLRGPGWNGDGYCVTSHGREWLASATSRPPTDPSRLVQIMQPFAARFGPGFLQRAGEASGCYRSGNYLACCVMAGAAAESILLAIAVAKLGDEAQVLKAYRSGSGRSRITTLILGQAKQALSDQFNAMLGVLNYWRDETAHGVHTTVGEAQAHLSVAQLIRFAHFAQDHWGTLTS
jgi:hypothetical protein